jgi:hypothetical protein
LTAGDEGLDLVEFARAEVAGFGSSPALKTSSFDSSFPVEPEAFTIDIPVRLHTLYAQ